MKGSPVILADTVVNNTPLALHVEAVLFQNGTESDTLYPQHITLVGTLVYISLGVWIMVSNAMIFLTHWKVPSVRNQHHLVTVLGIINFMTGFGGFVKAYSLNVKPYSITNRDCTLAYTVSGLGQVLDPIVVFTVTFYRWVAYKFPMGFWVLISKPYISAFYLTAFGYAGGLFLAGIILSDPKVYVRECGIIEVGVVLTRTIATFVSLPVIVLMVIVNLLLFRELRKHANESNLNRKQDKHRAESILIISMIYICTNIGGACMLSMLISMKDKGRAQLINLLITGPLSHVNYGINYYVYIWRNPDYRKLFRPGFMPVPT